MATPVTTFWYRSRYSSNGPYQSDSDDEAIARIVSRLSTAYAAAPEVYWRFSVLRTIARAHDIPDAAVVEVCDTIGTWLMGEPGASA